MANTKSITTDFSTTDVTFTIDELGLAGTLRLPSDQTNPLPAIVLTGPFTGVKEQVAGLYAERLAERGFATLAFDHRNFGGSDGSRRQHEDPAGKLVDLSAATSFLANHQTIAADRIGCVGICMGGGYALKHAAFDRRIKALAVVAAAFNDPKVMRQGIGAENYRQRLETRTTESKAPRNSCGWTRPTTSTSTTNRPTSIRRSNA